MDKIVGTDGTHLLGRAHYKTHYACYRELYPAKHAAEPVSRPDGAHTGLADHRKRRPARLVPEQQWRILAKLAELEQSGTCFLRTLLTDHYEGARREVPEAVTGMPSGLLRWEIEKVTRSTTALDKLLSAQLVAVREIPNLRWTASDKETIPLFCLTDVGRSHYARN